MAEPTSTAEISSTDHRVGQAYILFAVCLILVVTLGAVVQIWNVRIGLGLTEVILILLPAIAFVHRKGLSVVEAMRWRPISPIMAFLSVAIGVSSWGVAAGIFLFFRGVLGEPPSVAALEPTTVPDLMSVLFFAALLPGVCEETLFRGAIQGVLRRTGRGRSVVITALLFAVFHVNPWIFLSAFFLGIVFGTMVVYTGSTLPAILAHIATNTTAFTVTYLYHDQPESAAYVLMGVLALACCLTYPAFWLRARHIDAPHPLLAAVPAGVERALAWVFRLVAGTAAVLVVAAVTAVFLLVDVRSVDDDSMQPLYQRGDRLIIFKSGMVPLDLEAGDTVSYRSDGERALQTVVHVSEDSVWVGTEDTQEALLRSVVTGKVVYVIDRP